MPLDSNGVHLYDETENEATFSDVLNLLGNSVSTQVGLLKGRATALESDVAALGVWATYTPTIVITGGGNLGTSATTEFYYMRDGDDVAVDFQITLGTSPSITGDVTFTLPVTPARGHIAGRGVVRPNPASTAYAMTPVLLSSTTTSPVAVRYETGTPVVYTALGATAPASWSGGGGIIAGSLRYRAA